MEREVKYENLTATYTAELAQKLKDDHGLDIEKEILQILISELQTELKKEIEKEILQDLIVELQSELD